MKIEINGEIKINLEINKMKLKSVSVEPIDDR